MLPDTMDLWLRRPDVFMTQARARGVREGTILAVEAVLLEARPPP